jgi:glutamate synthase (NADPH/NADH) large chain
MFNKNFIRDWEKNKKKLLQNHVYSEDQEHSSCGVGLIASISGKPSRKIVEMGVQALRVLYHRGAIDADGKTGDGAGIQRNDRANWSQNQCIPFCSWYGLFTQNKF